MASMVTLAEDSMGTLLGDVKTRNRILEQALRASVGSRAKAGYFPQEAERVFFRITKQRGHPRSMGEFLSAIAIAECSEKKAACNRCPLQLFCLTGRPRRQAGVGIPFIDLFAGAGGFSLGFEAEGFVPTIAIDQDASAIRTYRFNRPSENLVSLIANVEDVAGDYHLRDAAPLVIGGPPCQSFSNANRQRITSDPRDALIGVFLDAAKKARAGVFVIENVPGVKERAEVAAAFGRQDQYTILKWEINASELGVPQRRKRIFIFGVRTRTPKQRIEVEKLFRQLTVTRDARAQIVLGDAIRDLPPVRIPSKRNSTTDDSPSVGFTVARTRHNENVSPYVLSINAGRHSNFLFNHRAKYLNERDRELYRLLRPGEKSDAESIAHIMPYKTRSHLFRDKFYRLKSNDLCKTITAHMYYDCHMYIHPTQTRGLTPREAARVQGFPDDYFFVGRPNEWYRQIGNAVSPPVAREVARIASALLAATGDFRNP